MSAINQFLLSARLSIRENPCVSPDFCLDFMRLLERLRRDENITHFAKSRFAVAAGTITLAEDADGDCAWILKSNRADAPKTLADGVALATDTTAFPATWQNLLRIKNLVQEHDAGSTIFPTATDTLQQSSLGVGARFTTLHWPAVEWTMAALGLSMTANQNSIPRELVYDVDAMLSGRLEGVPFPFIGADVPEGHQGQSVEGMSHGSVLSKLKTGFHTRRIAWGFNADHQPVGGKYDARENELVAGCLLSSYITFDLSPELSITPKQADPRAWCSQHVPADVLERVRSRAAGLGLALDSTALAELLCAVWPAVQKLQRRDRAYAEARRRAFTTSVGQAYFRELSIDELPGLTTPETLATMLALCEALDLRIHYVAPAFGFQKNFPFADNAELERRVESAWRICQAFGCSIGFHSGSGKSEENYRLCGRVTGSRLEIKTSGRYTYEMGRALAASSNTADQALWQDWYRFTQELAVASAFAENPQERSMARTFISHALGSEGKSDDVFGSRETCAQALSALAPSPDHMFWFEYNFLYVLAAEGRSDKASLGDHTPAGYRQRARFYAISEEGQLLYVKNVAQYLCFLAETTGQATALTCHSAREQLKQLHSYVQFLGSIAPNAAS
ncbi:MAG: tagaturonate epimerase family protein [Myxococcales bacterium]